MIDKHTAIVMLDFIPAVPALLQPCHEANPPLWRIYCASTNRPPDPSTVWTEHDVARSCLLMIRKYLNDIR